MSLFRCLVLLVLFLFPMISSQSFAQPTPNNFQRIIFLGDSITQSGDGHENGYVRLVRNELKARNASLEVIGAGISGNKVPDLQRRLKTDVLDKAPTIVVIYIGINDVWHSQKGKGTPKDKFKSGLQEIVGKIKEAGAEPVLCTASVIGEKTDGSNPLDKMLDEYCEMSRQVATGNGLQLIDLRNMFLDELKSLNPNNLGKGILTSDGVHLNKTGNQFVADRMLNALAPTLDKKELRHVVLFEFEDGVTDQQKQEIVSAFGNLKDKIDVISDFEYG
ncbi:MAG: GDSL-type esterase/lipase family protein, partial [Planctomycetota bacterium]